jgi:apolipoprotein N-acyltransferase
MNTAGLNYRGSTTGPKLGFVQPNAGALAKWDSAKIRENLETLADLSTYTSYLGAELILWPEAPTPLPLKGNASMKQWVDSLSNQLNLPILAGNVAREGGPTDENRKWYNAVFHVDPEIGTDVENYYSKRHLVPFGEYVPFARFLPFVKKFVPIEAAFFEGTEATLLELKNVDGKFSKVGNLICYEDIFPKLARENVLAGADWHFVATNNTWFGEEAMAWQHAAHSVLRAVETRRPVVRCGNAGWSGWIDEYGHVRHTVLDNTGSIYFQGVEAVDFYCSNWWANRISFYVQHGDWFVFLCAGMFGVAFFGGRFYRLLSRKNQVPLS